MAKKSKKTEKLKFSLRQRNVKAEEKKQKPKRVRKAAANVVKPVGKIAESFKKEFHVLPRREQPGFFTKSRNILPTYIVKSILELKNVTWPKRKETWKLVFAVFVFAIVIGAFITILDYGLEKVFQKVVLQN
jgi:preprotein translocase SecE subunit